ncbi:transposase [Methylobacterium sp. Leaf108]|nr:transposase [Methylobacterium sp. Leaf108]
MIGRLEDFCRIATRHDRVETNDLAAVCFAVTVGGWL